MENLIIECVRKYPGLRKRSIAYEIGVPFNSFFLVTLHNLIKNNILKEVDFKDSANMEFYSKYYVIN